MYRPQENTLEHFILYASYTKAMVKVISTNIQAMTDHGMLDDAEGALVDALLIGLAKSDIEFEEVIKHCMSRTDKADHLVLSVNQVLKDQGLNE